MALVIGCSEPNTDPTSQTWQLVTLEGEPVLEGTVIDLALEEDSVSGMAGCNSYSGPASFSDGTMSLGPDLAVTFVMCEEPTMALEHEYLTAFFE